MFPRVFPGYVLAISGSGFCCLFGKDFFRKMDEIENNVTYEKLPLKNGEKMGETAEKHDPKCVKGTPH